MWGGLEIEVECACTWLIEAQGADWRSASSTAPPPPPIWGKFASTNDETPTHMKPVAHSAVLLTIIASGVATFLLYATLDSINSGAPSN